MPFMIYYSQRRNTRQAQKVRCGANFKVNRIEEKIMTTKKNAKATTVVETVSVEKSVLEQLLDEVKTLKTELNTIKSTPKTTQKTEKKAKYVKSDKHLWLKQPNFKAIPAKMTSKAITTALNKLSDDLLKKGLFVTDEKLKSRPRIGWGKAITHSHGFEILTHYAFSRVAFDDKKALEKAIKLTAGYVEMANADGWHLDIYGKLCGKFIEIGVGENCWGYNPAMECAMQSTAKEIYFLNSQNYDGKEPSLRFRAVK